MNVYQSLKFVQGAVSKKDFVPALSHFQIKDGRITGYDGKMSLSSPIALDLDCCPKADVFAKAIATCAETASLSMQKNGKLAIKSGKFKAHIDCLPPELYPGQEPQGITTKASGPLLPALRVLHELSADDASRPWAAGVLLDGECFYATNNVIFAQYWTGNHFPYRVNIPRATVKEVIRIGEEPISLQVTANSITFHYANDRWLHSYLINDEWPSVTSILGALDNHDDANCVWRLLDQDFWEAVDTLEPFVDDLGHVYANAEGLHTAEIDGMSVELKDLPTGLYNHAMLVKLAGVALKIDLAQWPSPMVWFGDNVRGLFVGMRK